MTQGRSIVFPKDFDFGRLTKEDKTFVKILTCPNCNHVFFIDVRAIVEKYKESENNVKKKN